jgi:1-acyl-sn-glycerol-3-phosphate acyltransferase
MKQFRFELKGPHILVAAPVTMIKRALYSFFFRTLAGWKIDDQRPAGLDRYIVVVAPHTSNWDFFVGICVRELAGMGDVKYLAKDSLFKGPFGWFFRAMGGYPVDRSRHNNLVDAVVAMFDRGEIQKIAITPEGTRKYQPVWKTGFHRMATGAGVPIILGSFDYPAKTAFISEPFPLTDDPEHDIERMKDWFRPHKGRNPENGVR